MKTRKGHDAVQALLYNYKKKTVLSTPFSAQIQITLILATVRKLALSQPKPAQWVRSLLKVTWGDWGPSAIADTGGTWIFVNFFFLMSSKWSAVFVLQFFVHGRNSAIVVAEFTTWWPICMGLVQCPGVGSPIWGKENCTIEAFEEKAEYHY